MCPKERYIPVAHTQPKPPHVWLLFSWAGFKRAVLGTTILSNGKGNFGPNDRNDQTSQSGPPSKLVPNIPVWPNRNGPCRLISNRNFRNLGWMESASYLELTYPTWQREIKFQTRIKLNLITYTNLVPRSHSALAVGVLGTRLHMYIQVYLASIFVAVVTFSVANTPKKPHN